VNRGPRRCGDAVTVAEGPAALITLGGMSVVIAGGHGRVALMVSRLLAAQGVPVSGVIRRQEQAQALRAAGARPVVADLARATADELVPSLRGARAVLFAAGAGRGDAPGRANPIDHDGALVLADAAERAGARRFVMLSTMGADPAIDYPQDVLVETYLRAKGRADDDLLSRAGLETTVIRPCWFRDRPGTGRVHLAEQTAVGDIARADVAAVLAALLTTPATSPRVLQLTTGSTPVAEAVAPYVSRPRRPLLEELTP
jgi:nucleoside-diphosphate-sugar epimerase